MVKVLQTQKSDDYLFGGMETFKGNKRERESFCQ